MAGRIVDKMVVLMFVGTLLFFFGVMWKGVAVPSIEKANHQNELWAEFCNTNLGRMRTRADSVSFVIQREPACVDFVPDTKNE